MKIFERATTKRTNRIDKYLPNGMAANLSMLLSCKSKDFRTLCHKVVLKAFVAMCTCVMARKALFQLSVTAGSS